MTTEILAFTVNSPTAGPQSIMSFRIKSHLTTGGVLKANSHQQEWGWEGGLM